jgi:hypothetical protein
VASSWRLEFESHFLSNVQIKTDVYYTNVLFEERTGTVLCEEMSAVISFKNPLRTDDIVFLQVTEKDLSDIGYQRDATDHPHSKCILDPLHP